MEYRLKNQQNGSGEFEETSGKCQNFEENEEMLTCIGLENGGGSVNDLKLEAIAIYWTSSLVEVLCENGASLPARN